MNPIDLNILEKMKTSDEDIIYEVVREDYRNLFEVFKDFFKRIFSSKPNEQNNPKIIYLIASDKEGRFVEIENGVIVDIMHIIEWTCDLKNNFKKVIIEDYTYKKYRIFNR